MTLSTETFESVLDSIGLSFKVRNQIISFPSGHWYNCFYDFTAIRILYKVYELNSEVRTESIWSKTEVLYR